jgi:AcrR family transcriptional regulator
MAGQSSREVPAKVAARLYSAVDVIAENGLANTKIEEIAAASGVPKATLYYYFAGKEDILAFLLKDSLAFLAGDVATAADAPGTGRERLAGVVAVQIEHTLTNSATSRALIGDLGRAARLPDLAESVQAAFYDPIARVLRDGALDGSLRKIADPDEAALSIFGTVIMTGLIHAVVGTDRTAESITAGVLDLLLEGLQSRRT